MTTTVIKSVGSAGGRDFADLNAYATYVNAIDLPATDTIQVAELYNDSEFTPSSVTFNGVTDVSRYVIIRAATGQGFKDNAGVRTNALFYNVSNGVGISRPSTGTLMTIQSTVYFVGLQINIGILQVGGELHLDSCIIGDGLYANGGGIAADNTLVYITNLGGGLAVIYLDGSGTLASRDCTIVSQTASATYGVRNTTGGSVTVNGGALFGSTNAGTGSITYTNSMTDATGTTGLTGGKTFANQFVSTTTDLRAKTGADLANAGAPIGGITTDISGFTRNVSTPTIGAWELASVSGGGNGGLLLFGGSVGWTPLLGAAAAWKAANAIRRNATLSRRSLLGRW